MTTTNEESKCSICGQPLGSKHGHNAQPLKDGRCCNVCNVLVTRERLQLAGYDIDLAELVALEAAAENLRQRIMTGAGLVQSGCEHVWEPYSANPGYEPAYARCIKCGARI